MPRTLAARQPQLAASAACGSLSSSARTASTHSRSCPCMPCPAPETMTASASGPAAACPATPTARAVIGGYSRYIRASSGESRPTRTCLFITNVYAVSATDQHFLAHHANHAPGVSIAHVRPVVATLNPRARAERSMWPGTDSSFSPSMNKVGTAASGPRIGCSRHTGVTEGMLLAVHTARYNSRCMPLTIPILQSRSHPCISPEAQEAGPRPLQKAMPLWHPSV